MSRPNHLPLDANVDALNRLNERVRALEAHRVGTGGTSSAQVVTSESTNSTSFTDITTPGPSATVTVGSSGSALVSVYCIIEPAFNQEADLGLSIDGAASFFVTGAAAVASSSSDPTVTAALTAPASGAYLATGLTPGPHTFKLQYRATSGGVSNFQQRVIVVIPL